MTVSGVVRLSIAGWLSSDTDDDRLRVAGGFARSGKVNGLHEEPSRTIV
jgi:hypothetical protein